MGTWHRQDRLHHWAHARRNPAGHGRPDPACFLSCSRAAVCCNGRRFWRSFYSKRTQEMKIDIFNHIFPKKYYDKYIDAGHGGKDIGKRVSNIQTIVDVDSRFRILDEFGDYVQVITLPLPPVEILAGPDESPELARVGNDGLAELVQNHDRFLGFAASLPMNNPDAALKEMERALDQLGAFGVQ